jgi:hypothetical protein
MKTKDSLTIDNEVLYDECIRIADFPLRHISLYHKYLLYVLSFSQIGIFPYLFGFSIFSCIIFDVEVRFPFYRIKA